jgi:hypothetical protein
VRHCSNAAAKGHVDILKWLRSHDPLCPWDADCGMDPTDACAGQRARETEKGSRKNSTYNSFTTNGSNWLMEQKVHLERDANVLNLVTICFSYTTYI